MDVMELQPHPQITRTETEQKAGSIIRIEQFEDVTARVVLQDRRVMVDLTITDGVKATRSVQLRKELDTIDFDGPEPSEIVYGSTGVPNIRFARAIARALTIAGDYGEWLDRRYPPGAPLS